MSKYSLDVDKYCKVVSIHTWSTMLWTMDIDVYRLSRRKIKLVLLEQSITYDGPRRASSLWRVRYPPYDVTSQLGAALLRASPEWRIDGIGAVKAEPESKIDEEYLALCWYRSEFEVVGRILSGIEPSDRAIIYASFVSFQDPELLECCQIMDAWMARRAARWSDVVARSEPSSDTPVLLERSWWRNMAATFRAELKKEDTEREQRRARRMAAVYGDPSLFIDLGRLVEIHGKDIPPGYLLHMTLFPSPVTGSVCDVLAMAWGRQTRPLPAGEGGITPRVPGVSIGDADLAFAYWLFNNNKAEKFERLRALGDPDGVSALNKLRTIAARGRADLSSLTPGSCSGLALSIGRGLARMRVALDPGS